MSQSRPIRPRLVSAGDGFAHGSVGLHIFHPVIVHYPKMPRTKCLSHSHRHLRFRFDYLGAHFLRLGAHLLLDRNCCRSAHLRFRLSDAFVCLPLFGLGASITFGLMLVRTASSTVLPVPFVARSMAQARLKSSVIPALSAAMSASTTWLTSPPAR